MGSTDGSGMHARNTCVLWYTSRSCMEMKVGNPLCTPWGMGLAGVTNALGGAHQQRALIHLGNLGTDDNGQ